MTLVCGQSSITLHKNGTITLRGVRQGDTVSLSVEDNGIGIEPRLLPRLLLQK